MRPNNFTYTATSSFHHHQLGSRATEAQQRLWKPADKSGIDNGLALLPVPTWRCDANGRQDKTGVAMGRRVASTCVLELPFVACASGRVYCGIGFGMRMRSMLKAGRVRRAQSLEFVDNDERVARDNEKKCVVSPSMVDVFATW
ncbi:hypothetical protein SEUCBS139899_005237 [Sporothrix eucalyptigena]